MKPSDYWLGNSTLQHITPKGIRWPEIGLTEALSQAIGNRTVFELGCGDGRLSSLFYPSRYIGMDINPSALLAAQRANPAHRYISDWRSAECVLAYTVLLHVPDDEIAGVIDQMTAYPRIIIGEITGRQWRTSGPPPVFNRAMTEYEDMLGAPCSEVIHVAYPHYRTDLELMIWDR